MDIREIEDIIDIASLSGLEKGKVESIVKYITFEPSRRNVDIMYQPIVILSNKMAIIAPMLFMGSRPERNLLAVVSSKKDSEHSKEVKPICQKTFCLNIECRAVPDTIQKE